jgi:peroxiredoxin
MAQLRHDYQDFVQKDTEVIVIGPEKKEAFQTYWKDAEIPFIGLADPAHSILKLYGQEVNLFKLGRMPAQAIIDRQGLVRFIHYGHSMQDIPDNEEILKTLDAINREIA